MSISNFKKQFILSFEFLKAPFRTAEILSNSKYLIDEMVGKVDFSDSKVMLELGSGTGSITNEIAKKISKDTTFLVIEYNNKFARHLKKMDLPNNVKIIQDDATNLDKHLDGKKGPADIIFSGLPLLTMNKNVVDKIVRKCRDNIKSDGSFILYQLTLHRIGILKKYFSNISVRRVWRNLPPYYVITCRK